MKLTLYCLSYFLIFSSFLRAQALDPIYTESAKIPKVTKDCSYGPFNIKYPSHWLLTKPRVGEGIQIESKLRYYFGAKQAKFAFNASIAFVGDSTLDDYIKRLEEAIKKADIVRNNYNKSERVEDSKKLGIDVELKDKPSAEFKPIKVSGKTVYISKSRSEMKVNGYVGYLITDKMWCKVSDTIYVFGCSYPESDKKRFSESAKWMLDNVTIK